MITPKRSNKKIEAQSNCMNLEDETEQQPRRSTKKVINEAQSNYMNLDDDDEDVTKNKKRSTRKSNLLYQLFLSLKLYNIFSSS